MTSERPRAKREIRTLTGPFEKRVLPKMARALPPWVTPDHLTMLGLVAAVLIAVGYYLTQISPWWMVLVNASLIVHWYADSLDGTLARVRKIERERYGYFIDHICDAMTALLVCLGLGASPYMHLQVGLMIVIGYLMMNIYAHVAAYAEGRFKLSYGRFGPTEVRMVLFVLNIVVVFWNPPLYVVLGLPFRVLDFLGVAVMAVLLTVFTVCSIRDAKELDRRDRAAWAEVGTDGQQP
jgi:archaetidylinositol phosphate synthase